MTERVDRWIQCKDPVPKEGRGKRPKIAGTSEACLSLDADHYIVCIDPPGGMPLSQRNNSTKTRRHGREQLAKRDRLRPLVNMIGNCMTLARHIDAKGLDDVVVALHKAYSKTLDHQFGR